MSNKFGSSPRGKEATQPILLSPVSGKYNKLHIRIGNFVTLKISQCLSLLPSHPPSNTIKRRPPHYQTQFNFVEPRSLVYPPCLVDRSNRYRSVEECHVVRGRRFYLRHTLTIVSAFIYLQEIRASYVAENTPAEYPAYVSHRRMNYATCNHEPASRLSYFIQSSIVFTCNAIDRLRMTQYTVTL